MRRQERVSVQATRLDESGRGVGAAPAGYEVRVADLLPGESADVVVEHVSPHQPIAWARIESRIGPSAAERVEPPCPAFGRCGGCAWQHLAYDAQLTHKQRRVTDALNALDPAPAVEPMVAAPRQVGYRNKGKYVIGPGPILGAYVPRTHRVVDTAGCTAVHPAIDRAAAKTRAALEEAALPIYDEATREGHLRYAVIRADRAGDALIGLVTTGDAPRDRLVGVAARLGTDSAVRGVVWLTNDAPTGAILDPSREPELLAGASRLTEQVAGVEIEVGIAEFLQVNREQAARMYTAAALAASGARAGSRAVDLYCGVGGISFALVRAGAEVLGIESHLAAVATATRAAACAGLEGQVRFRAGDAASLATIAADFPADAVVVDPPRKGLGAAVRAALCALAPRTLVYVSCEPTTLAGDLAILQEAAGYRVERVLPFDLMPGTPQVETLVVCRRG